VPLTNSAEQLDKLVISQLGLLAQRRLARGVKLNHSEACVGYLNAWKKIYVLIYFRQALIANNLQEVS
jgi:urease